MELNYSFIFTEDNKNKILKESNSSLLCVTKSDELVDKLKNRDEFSITYKCGETEYVLDNCFTIVVKVKEVGKFYFVFKDKEFDLEKLKENLLTLKDVDASTDELKLKKINDMFNCVNEFNPLFAYLLRYSRIVEKVNFEAFNYPFVTVFEDKVAIFIRKVLAKIKEKRIERLTTKKEKVSKNKEEAKQKAIKEVEQKDRITAKLLFNLDSWLAFFNGALMVISSSFVFNLLKENNSLAYVFIILLVTYFALDTFVSKNTLRTNKTNRSIFIKLLPLIVFSLVGFALGFGIYVLLASFVRKPAEGLIMWHFYSNGLVLSLILVSLSFVAGCFVNKYANKKVTKN